MKTNNFICRATMLSLAGILSAHAAGPFAYTQPSWAVKSTLNGMAGPGGLPSTAWFEWGLTKSYGQTTAAVFVGDSSGVVRVSATLSNLTLGNVYHARLVVSNATGVAFGMDQPLVTPGRMKAALLGIEHCYGFPPLPNKTDLPGWQFPRRCSYDAGGGPITAVPPGISNIVGIGPDELGLRSDGIAFRHGDVVFTNVVAVEGPPARGYGGDLGLHHDGTIVGARCGPSPPGLTNAIAVSRGVDHELALRTDGTVVAWGCPGINPAITTLPVELTNVVAIAAGGAGSSVALRIDGTVVAWGMNRFGETNVPADATNVVAVTAGLSFFVAVRRDGSVITWPGPFRPGAVGSLTNVISAVARDNGQLLALHDNGQVTEFGDSHYSGGFFVRSLYYGIVAISRGLALGPNQAPFEYPQVVTAPPEADVIIKLAAFDPNRDALNVRIAGLPNAGALYQFQSGGRGAPILAPDTLVTDLERRVVFAPAVESATLDQSFTIIANDGELDSEPIRHTVSLSPTFPHMRWDRYELSKEFYSLRFSGNPNSPYRVWASTNLLNWEALGQPFRYSASEFRFGDYNPQFPARFYRVSSP